MEASIIAAIISAIVATLGVFVSIRSLRWNMNLKTKELDLKNNELTLKVKEYSASTQELANDVEAIRQSQFSETIHKRTEIYPLLWSTIREYTTNWDDEHKYRDLLWVKEFLAKLNQVDSIGGVFFSQAVYERFHTLQLFLFQLKEQLTKSETKAVNLQDLEHIDTIFRGQPGSPGLAAYLKDDLGSYRDLSIQARSIPTEAQPVIASKASDGTITTNLTPTSIFYKPNSCPGIGIFAVSDKDLKQIASLRKKFLETSKSVLLIPTTGIIAIEAILKSQSGFNDILECLREYISEEYLEVDEERIIETTESLFLSGLVDGFCSISIKRFIETKYQIQFTDIEWDLSGFDTLLELAAIVYCNIQKK